MPSDHSLAPKTCSDLADDLAAVDDTTGLGDPSRDHVQQCLRCQAEVAHYRRMRRTMRTLAGHPGSVDPGFEHEILLVLDHEDGRLVNRVPARTAATLGGLAAAASVIVFAARHRRLAS